MATDAEIRAVFSQFRYRAPDAADFASLIAEVQTDAYRRRLLEIGRSINVTPAQLDADVRRWIAEESAKWSASVVQTHNDDLRSMLSGLPDKTSQAEATQAANAWEQERSQWKGDQIAFNESMRARTRADVDFLSRNSLEVGGEVVPRIAKEPRCQALVDMGMMDAETTAQVASTLPLHVNCMVEGTRVLPIGRLDAASRVAFEGPVYRISTESGAEITATPNHPILAAGWGWTAAQLLQEGDKVINYIGANGFRGDFDHVPAAIEDVFGALRQLGQHRRSIATSSDFHRDGRFMNGDIDVVFADGLLSRELDAAFGQQFTQDNFEMAGVKLQSFAHFGSVKQFFRGSLAASHGSMSSFNMGRVVVATPHSDTSFAELHLHTAIRHTSILGEPVISLPSFISSDVLPEVRNVDRRCRSGPSGRIKGWRPDDYAPVAQDFRERLQIDVGLFGDSSSSFDAEQITLDKVIHIQYIPDFSGHVYDLQTGSGMYVADGIIVHNCAHAIRYQRDLREVAAGGVRWLGSELVASEAAA